MLFQVSYERFLEEVRFEKIGQGAKDQLEVEDFGDMLIYYLVCFERNKTFIFVVNKNEIDEVMKFQLNSISKPSRRIIDKQMELKQIIVLLQELITLENESEEQ